MIINNIQLTKKNFSIILVTPPGLFIIALLFIGPGGYAQYSSNKISIKKLLAAADRKKEQTCKVKEANVIFPDILKGNEEEAMDYIENFSKRRKAYLVRMHTKGKTLLPRTEEILRKYNLPVELKMLLPLESAYNANAISKAGAVGYWQIMDEVAMEYGMKCAQRKQTFIKNSSKKKAKTKQKDDRMNFIKSTVTAARYLHARRLNLDDNWLLVVASYNCGVGNVWSAMKRTGKSNPDFWDVKKYLPAETRSYVMNFITLNVIFTNYDNFIKNKLVFKPVKVKQEEDSISDNAVTADL